MKLDDEIIQTFIEEAQDLLRSIYSHFESWQTTHEVEKLSSILRDLHTLKGSSRMVGYIDLSEYIHALEQLVEVNSKNDKLPIGEAEIVEALDFINLAIEEIKLDPAKMDINYPIDNINHLIGDVTVPVLNQPVHSQQETIVKRSEGNSSDYVRIKSGLLSNFSKLSGIVNVTRAHIEQQVMGAREILSDISKETKMIHEQMRHLQIKTDASLKMAANHLTPSEEFDVLELDRYSFLQQSTRFVLDKINLLEELGLFLSNTLSALESALMEQSRATKSLDESIMHTRMVSLDSLVERLNRTARQVARELNKNVLFKFVRAQGEADRKIIEKLTPALEHMIRNAIDHGIEDEADRVYRNKPKQGLVQLSLYRQGNEIVIEMSDDGQGINLQKIYQKAIQKKLWPEGKLLSNEDAIKLISIPGFSTKEEITPISGRGVGMDVVTQEINELGGNLQVDSNERGTKFIIRLPFSLSLNFALIFNASEDYAMLLSGINHIARFKYDEINELIQQEKKEIVYANETYSLYYLPEVLGNKKWNEVIQTALPVIFLKYNDSRVAFIIDKIVGSREIVIKPLGYLFETLKIFSGVSILGDGRTVLVLNASYLIIYAQRQGNVFRDDHLLDSHEQKRLKVLVTDDSITVRQVTSRFLRRHQYTPITAKDGVDALYAMAKNKPDVVLLDIEMPRMDGFEVINAMRNSDDLKNIPVIMITSRSLEKHRVRAMKAGANAYLTKPYREDQLLEILQRVQPR